MAYLNKKCICIKQIVIAIRTMRPFMSQNIAIRRC